MPETGMGDREMPFSTGDLVIDSVISSITAVYRLFAPGGEEQGPEETAGEDGADGGGIFNAAEQAAALLEELAASDGEPNELLLARLCALQEESNRLVGTLSGGGASGSFDEAMGKTADVLTILSTLWQTTNFLSDGALGAWAKEAIVKHTAPLLKALPAAGRGILQAGQGLLTAGAVEGAAQAAAQAALPGLGLQLGAAFAFPAMFLGMSWLTRNDPEVQETRRKLNEGGMTEQDYIDAYGDTPLGRSNWLGYLAGEEDGRHWLERSLGEESMSFSEADQKRLERRESDPEYDRLYREVYGNTEDVADSQEPNTIAAASKGRRRNGIHALNGQEDKPKAKAGGSRSIAAAADRNGGLAEGENAFENEIGANGAPHGAQDAPNLPTGAWLESEEPAASPYRLETPSGGAAADPDGGAETANRIEILTETLGRLADAYALPRVTVGSLAESLVVREDADIDRIAAQLADKLREAQMVS